MDVDAGKTAGTFDTIELDSTKLPPFHDVEPILDGDTGKSYDDSHL